MARSLVGIYLENFQSIRGPVSLDLAPVTLLYGPNSAGKSAIHDALQLVGKLSAGEWPHDELAGSMHYHDYEKRMVIAVRYTAYFHPLLLDESTVGMSWSSYEETFPILRAFLDSDEFQHTMLEAKFEIVFHWEQLPSGKRLDESPSGRTLNVYAGRETVSIGGIEFITNDLAGEAIIVNLKHPFMAAIDSQLRTFGASFLSLAESVFVPDVISVSGPLLHIRVRNALCDRAFGYDDNDEDVLQAGMHESQKRRLLEAMIGTAFLVPMKVLERLRTDESQSDRIHIGPLRTIPSDKQLTFFLRKSHFSGTLSAFASLEPSSRRWLDGTAAWWALAENEHYHEFSGGGSQSGGNLLTSVNEWLSANQRLGLSHILNVSYGSVNFATEQKNTPVVGWMGWRFQSSVPDVIATLQLQDLNLGLLVSMSEVGTGIPQLVPIIAAGFISHHTVSVEQPELHLHPKLQTEIADFFISRWNANRVHFVVETHSEYIALRLLRRIREANNADVRHRDFSISEEDVAFYYFDPIDGVTQVKRLHVSRDGEFIDRWPKGFFPEREAELFDEDD